MTDLDTAYNYRAFTSHRKLAATAGELLSDFTISTKVGFFPGNRRHEHSLDPVRLRCAIHESVQDLGVQPDVVLLHNPERTLARLAPEQGRDCWAAACTFGLSAHARWGMSPYGGQATHPIWDKVDVRQLLHRNQGCSPISAAFRLAYELPQVSQVAVGVSTAEHLAELVTATSLHVDHDRIARTGRCCTLRRSLPKQADQPGRFPLGGLCQRPGVAITGINDLGAEEQLGQQSGSAAQISPVFPLNSCR